MINKWRNYALKSGKVQSSYQREYCNRKKCRKERVSGSGDSHVESREVQTKEEVGNHEVVREENSVEAHQQGQQRVQEPAKRRSKAAQRDSEKQTGEEEVKEKEKMTPKEKKHEAKEGKDYEKKEDRREAKKEASKKKK